MHAEHPLVFHGTLNVPCRVVSYRVVDGVLPVFDTRSIVYRILLQYSDNSLYSKYDVRDPKKEWSFVDSVCLQLAFPASCVASHWSRRSELDSWAFRRWNMDKNWWRQSATKWSMC